MSLLNQVLQDLDQRTPAAERPALRLAESAAPGDDEYEAPIGQTDWARISAWSLVLGLSLVVAWTYWQDGLMPDTKSAGSSMTADMLSTVRSAAPLKTGGEDALPSTPANGSATIHADPLVESAGGTEQIVASGVAEADADGLRGSGPTDSKQVADEPISLHLAAPASQGDVEPGWSPEASRAANAVSGRFYGGADAVSFYWIDAVEYVQPESMQLTGHDLAETDQDSAVEDYLPLRNVTQPEAFDSARRAAKSSNPKRSFVRQVPLSNDATLDGIQRMIKAGRLAEAEASLRTRLQADPADLESRELLLGLMLRDGRTEDAMVALDAGLAVRPGHTAFIVIKARLLAESGELQRALRLLEGTPYSPRFAAQILQMLGAMYQQMTDYQAAARSYRQLVQLQPRVGSGWAGLALGLDGLQSLQARDAYRKALQLGGLPVAVEQYARQRLAELDDAHE